MPLPESVDVKRGPCSLDAAIASLTSQVSAKDATVDELTKQVRQLRLCLDAIEAGCLTLFKR